MDTLAFREDYRKTRIGARYLGWAHFAFTSMASLLVVSVAIWRVRSPSWAELAVVPLTFLFANLVEYRGHKSVMHVSRPGFRLVYQRHTLDHHRFFTAEVMVCESPRDFQIMLFPPILLLFFLGGVAVPPGVLLFLLWSANAGWLFVATAMGYFLLYEWLHFCYHLPPDSAVGRMRLVRLLRRHHAAHHDPARMTRWNFNITFPISDLLFGTIWREE